MRVTIARPALTRADGRYMRVVRLTISVSGLVSEQEGVEIAGPVPHCASFLLWSF
jgi:hypothetical protein